MTPDRKEATRQDTAQKRQRRCLRHFRLDRAGASRLREWRRGEGKLVFGSQAKQPVGARWTLAWVSLRPGDKRNRHFGIGLLVHYEPYRTRRTILDMQTEAAQPPLAAHSGDALFCVCTYSQHIFFQVLFGSAAVGSPPPVGAPHASPPGMDNGVDPPWGNLLVRPLHLRMQTCLIRVRTYVILWSPAEVRGDPAPRPVARAPLHALVVREDERGVHEVRQPLLAAHVRRGKGILVLEGWD